MAVDPSVKMEPIRSLPVSDVHTSVESYVEGLLQFVSESEILRALCGGVHILDFLTSEPDHFTSLLPPEWSSWLVKVPIPDLLDLLMREDLAVLLRLSNDSHDSQQWRGYSRPPPSFLAYIMDIRNLCLDRSFKHSQRLGQKTISARVAMGMGPKKVHEVGNFAAFVGALLEDCALNTDHRITTVLDFGAGLSYLGRVLASPPYERNVVAVESRASNIDAAKRMDLTTGVSKNENPVWRNKKRYKASGIDTSAEAKRGPDTADKPHGAKKHSNSTTIASESQMSHRIQYIEKSITDGDLQDVFQSLETRASCCSRRSTVDGLDDPSDISPETMVVSLHSCGNLIHHGLRSLILNPNVKAVAMIGCCYNLATERFGPPSYKFPRLRLLNKNPDAPIPSSDPHGFPMSERLSTYASHGQVGFRLNITARMMAVQAPQNWTQQDCDSFFTRHFYRALLQRILVDKRIVEPPTVASERANDDKGGEPVLLGSLRKACYQSFVTYVRGATEKLKADTARESLVVERLETLSDEEILLYWERYKHKKHQLSVVWSLMAFSAGVIESLIVTDRWLYLKEQPCVKQCWVQTVFDYEQSPRNLVIVGIKG